MQNRIALIALTVFMLALPSAAQAGWAVYTNDTPVGQLIFGDFGAESVAAAKKNARTRCGYTVGKCKLLESGTGGCFVSAKNRTGWTYAIAPTSRAAEKSALADCKAKFGKWCKATKPWCDK